MKTINVSVARNDGIGFYAQIKAASAAIVSVFRDGMGFMAVELNGGEYRVTAADNATKAPLEAFFHQGEPFTGSINVPEYADFGEVDPTTPVSPVVNKPVKPAEPIPPENIQLVEPVKPVKPAFPTV
jgi:hypothetical protein